MFNIQDLSELKSAFETQKSMSSGKSSKKSFSDLNSQSSLDIGEGGGNLKKYIDTFSKDISETKLGGIHKLLKQSDEQSILS